MANDWKVEFTDNEEDAVQTASFASRKAAQDWIRCQEINDRYDPTGFEVVCGPYLDKGTGKLSESDGMRVKVWVDDIRPAPDGYLWIKSTNEFVKFIDDNGLECIEVIDLDHDAGDYASDGGDYIKCLDYLEFIGADGIKVRVHSANPVGVAKMKAIIKKNQWDEVFDVIDEDEVDECLDGGDYDDLAKGDNIDEDDEVVDEQEDTAAKSKIITSLKNVQQDFKDAASNYDPTKFADIIVEFDKLISDIGLYDFKEKKELTEVDDDIEEQEAEDGAR